MAEVQISVATDMRTFEPSLITLMSAIESTPRPVTVHFLGKAMTDAAMLSLERAVACWPETELRFHDLSGELTRGGGWETLKWNGRHSEVMLADVHVPKLAPGRILHLDTDTLVCADIGPLFDMDLQGCHVGAVRDYGYLVSWSELTPSEWPESIWDSIAAIHPHSVSDFPNAGVMLFDNDSIASEPGLAEAISDPRGLLDDTHRFVHTLKGRIHYLDPSWNTICGSHNRYGRAHKAMLPDGHDYFHRPPRIMHHPGSSKPWHNFDLNGLLLDFEGERERLYQRLDLASHGRPITQLFPEVRDSICLAEYIDGVRTYRMAYNRYMGMLVG